MTSNIENTHPHRYFFCQIKCIFQSQSMNLFPCSYVYRLFWKKLMMIIEEKKFYLREIETMF